MKVLDPKYFLKTQNAKSFQLIKILISTTQGAAFVNSKIRIWLEVQQMRKGAWKLYEKSVENFRFTCLSLELEAQYFKYFLQGANLFLKRTSYFTLLCSIKLEFLRIECAAIIKTWFFSPSKHRDDDIFCN